jgi:hypothetical protein
MPPLAACRRALTASLLTASLLNLGASLVAAAEPIAVQPPAGRAAGPAAAPDHDEEAAAALAFAAEHHPELVPLLERLRREAATEFAAAIADLEKTRERIARLGDRQPERQAAALADWKLSSRIRLALARLATNPSAEAEAELRELVATRARNRMAAARAERERTAARLEKLTAELADFDRDPEAAIDREFTAIRARAARGGKRDKSP